MEVVSFTPRPPYPCKKSRDTHWTRNWVGASQSEFGSERKNSATAGKRTPVVQHKASHYTVNNVEFFPGKISWKAPAVCYMCTLNCYCEVTYIFSFFFPLLSF